MNKIFLIIFLSLLVVFILAMIFIGKISIRGVISKYFRNYYSNAENENERKFNIWFLIFLGLLPYCLGVLMFFAFKTFFLSIDYNMLLQINIILLTIFCLFLGFNFKREDKKEVKKELVATLLVNILLIVIASILLISASSVSLDDNAQPTDTNLITVLLSVYYALMFKIFVLFFYCLKRIYILSSSD